MQFNIEYPLNSAPYVPCLIRNMGVVLLRFDQQLIVDLVYEENS